MLDPDSDGVLVASSLRARRPEAKELLGFLGQAHAHGVDVDWGLLFERAHGARIELPTYAFQRQRYWLEGTGGATDARSLGQHAGEHPLLSAALHLAREEDGWLFTGRLSLKRHQWLRDHAVMGQVLMPGTGLVELALAAGERVGATVVEELTLERPMLFGEEDAVAGPALGLRPRRGRHALDRDLLHLQSSLDEEPEQEEWTRHASGTLGEGEGEETGSGDGGSGAWLTAHGRPRARRSSTRSSSTTAWRRPVTTMDRRSRDCARPGA